MGWFSDLFKKGTSESPYRSATLEPDKPWSRAESNESSVTLSIGAIYVPPKNISEPVHAIVEAMKERPSNFKLIDTKHDGGPNYSLTSYTVKDIKTSKSLTVTHQVSFYSTFQENYTYSWAWLTEDEGKLLLKDFTELNKRKLKRKLSIERAAMKAIYQ